jgi:hypothetical protein
VGGERDKRTVAAGEPSDSANGGHEDMRDLTGGFRMDGWIWRELLYA